MKKLTLDLEALVIQSFDVVDARWQTEDTDLSVTLPGCCITFTCGDSRIRPCLED